MTKKATASIASHLLQQKPGEMGAALQPIATQGRSYKRSRSLVGAALCRDGPQSGPRPQSGLRMKLVIPQVPTPLPVDPPQLRLQMQTPDLRILGHLIAMQGQAVDNGIEHRFGHQRPMERPLCLDRGGLFTGHAGGEQQRPHTVVPGQRTDAAFDAGHQAQALACEAEIAHGRAPSNKPCSA
ncbi:protein of unknown function [Pseudomonas sp. JV551A1]|nr:protein of unknown function [Pseudomonas sp. JV551A1]